MSRKRSAASQEVDNFYNFTDSDTELDEYVRNNEHIPADWYDTETDKLLLQTAQETESIQQMVQQLASGESGVENISSQDQLAVYNENRHYEHASGHTHDQFGAGQPSTSVDPRPAFQPAGPTHTPQADQETQPELPGKIVYFYLFYLFEVLQEYVAISLYSMCVAFHILPGDSAFSLNLFSSSCKKQNKQYIILLCL